jgi:hypothetical protein
VIFNSLKSTDLEMVDQTGVVPTGRAEGEAVCLATVWFTIDRTNVREMVAHIFTSWNPLATWLGQLEAMKQAA